MSLKHTGSLQIQTLQELPYYGVTDLVSCHGQFNNTLSYDLPTKKYLEKLSSLNDLDLFTLNVRENTNPDLNLINQHIQSNYYSPHIVLMSYEIGCLLLRTTISSFLCSILMLGVSGAIWKISKCIYLMS